MFFLAITRPIDSCYRNCVDCKIELGSNYSPQTARGLVAGRFCNLTSRLENYRWSFPKAVYHFGVGLEKRDNQALWS
jgi:hypothetical protein